LDLLTALRWAEVLAGSRGPGPSAPGLLDAESPALVDLSLKSILGSVGALRSHHLHKAETTALTSVWVAHDVALLDVAVLLEELADLVLVEARVDAGDEEIGARVDRLIVAVLTGVASWGWTTGTC